jgi:ammonium transporter, Amt family
LGLHRAGAHARLRRRARGLLEGNTAQLINQCIGVGIVLGYSAVVTLIILLLVKLFIGLRVDTQTERDGLDLALHGEMMQ